MVVAIEESLVEQYKQWSPLSIFFNVKLGRKSEVTDLTKSYIKISDSCSKETLK